MANIYWGDTFHKPDGNWNHTANWYLTLGNPGCCCGGRGGTAAGRVPQAGDSVVIVGGTALDTLPSLQGDVTTGPTGGWAGPVSFYESTFNFPSNTFIRAGSYSGTVTVGTHNSFPTVLSTASVFQFGIGGGTFTGTVTLGKLNLSTGGTGDYQLPVLSGGTYSPSASCALGAGNILNDTNLPVDPGFAVGGGIFSPVITVTGAGGIMTQLQVPNINELLADVKGKATHRWWDWFRSIQSPKGFSGTIVTAKLSVANGSMTFQNGILTSQVAAT